jgi:NADP-dependent 3-hydroxy acid dehydrogenase YdfG
MFLCGCSFAYLELNPLQVHTHSGDVKNFESINIAIEAAVSDFGAIEVLVLSHGVSSVYTFEDQSVEDFDHIIDTNLKGNIHTIKAALPHIKASEGAPASISMFSSQAGQVRFPLIMCPL